MKMGERERKRREAKGMEVERVEICPMFSYKRMQKIKNYGEVRLGDEKERNVIRESVLITRQKEKEMTIQRRRRRRNIKRMKVGFKNEISKKVKLATIVVGDPKSPFSIATTPRCREGHYSFPRRMK